MAEIYNTTTKYDEIMARLNTNLLAKCNIEYQSTLDDIEAMLLKNPGCITTEMRTQRETLRAIESVLGLLFDLRYYRHLRKLSHDVEYPLCVRCVDHFVAYFFCGVGIENSVLSYNIFNTF